MLLAPATIIRLPFFERMTPVQTILEDSIIESATRRIRTSKSWIGWPQRTRGRATTMSPDLPHRLVSRHQKNSTKSRDFDAEHGAQSAGHCSRRPEEDCPVSGPVNDHYERLLTRIKVTKTVEPNRCLFCDQVQNKVNGVRQSLLSCMTFEACDAIYYAAYVRGDKDVLLEVQPGQPDLIAKEICYHHCCYAKHTHEKTLHGLSEEKVCEESSGKRRTEYSKAFSRLADEIQDTILSSPGEGKIASMTDLCARYVVLLNDEGLTDLDSYRTDRLKLRLVERFGDQLVFFLKWKTSHYS